MNFIDSHVHYIEEDPLEYIETLLRRMDEHDVEKAVLFGVQGHPLCSDAGVWHVTNRYPDRFIPFACSIRCEHTRDAEVFLQYLRNWGPWMGVGEIFVDLGPMEAPTPYIDRHGRQCVYPRYCPEDKSHNQVYAEVFSYCADSNLPVLVHCVDVKTMENVLKRFPSTIFIWAHADWWLPETDTVPLLEERSNLYCEIASTHLSRMGDRFEPSMLNTVLDCLERYVSDRSARWPY